MTPEYSLFLSGLLLLAISALMGFAQYRFRAKPETFAIWRVVHSGGTAGAVQLLALGAVWYRLGLDPRWGIALASALIAATWAFFLGPLARAIGFPRAADLINKVGGLIALPAYLALPLPLLL